MMKKYDTEDVVKNIVESFNNSIYDDQVRFMYIFCSFDALVGFKKKLGILYDITTTMQQEVVDALKKELHCRV